jgi:hypothetical protein
MTDDINITLKPGQVGRMFAPPGESIPVLWRDPQGRYVKVRASKDIQAPPPDPDPEPPVPAPGGFLLGVDLASLPTSGAAWDAMLAKAKGSWPAPNLTDQNSQHAAHVLAGALVAARTGDAALKTKVMAGILDAIRTHKDGTGNNALSLGRQLAGYVIAASAIGYRDPAFLDFLRDIRTRNVGGHSRWYSLYGTAADSSNNWHVLALTSLTAIDIYLGDTAGIDRDAALFRGYCGDRSAHTFRTPSISQPSWLADPSAPWTPIQNAPGDPRHGAPTEDAWRSGAYPTISNTYVMDAVGGAVMTAELLSRAGYTDVFARLANVIVFTQRFPSVWTTSGGRGGQGLAYLVNRRTGAGVPTTNTTSRIAWTHAWLDWLYGSGA